MSHTAKPAFRANTGTVSFKLFGKWYDSGEIVVQTSVRATISIQADSCYSSTNSRFIRVDGGGTADLTGSEIYGNGSAGGCLVCRRLERSSWGPARSKLPDRHRLCWPAHDRQCAAGQQRDGLVGWGGILWRGGRGGVLRQHDGRVRDDRVHIQRWADGVGGGSAWGWVIDHAQRWRSGSVRRHHARRQHHHQLAFQLIPRCAADVRFHPGRRRRQNAHVECGFQESFRWRRNRQPARLHLIRFRRHKLGPARRRTRIF